MTKAHAGSMLPIKNGIILPIEYQDVLFPFYWNKVSGRGHEPLTDVSTIVPTDKFGYALAVEDGTENAILTSSNGESNNVWNTDHGGSGVTIIRSQDTKPVFGDYIAKWSKSTKSGTGNCYINGSRFSGTSSNVWTFSCFVKRADGKPVTSVGSMYIYVNGLTYWYQTPDKIEYAGNGWYRVVKTRSDIDVPRTLSLVGFSALDGTTDWFFDGWQVEPKPWATSFVDGTRPNGEFTLSKEIVNLNSFTINSWVKRDSSTSSNHPVLEVASNSGNSGGTISIGHQSSTGQLRIWSSNSSNTNTDVVGLTPPTNEWYMITATFNGAVMKLYYNGELQDEKPATISLSSGATFNIGGKHWGRLNGKLSNFLISPRAWSEQEIKAMYMYDKPMYDPYNYYSIWSD